MSNIEVGEYYRTEKGKIYKWSKGRTYIGKDKIVKHSKSIIDLIQVGDYVNGYYVERVWEQVNYRMAIDLRGSYLGLSDDKFIKSIVTHEMIKEMEYRVDE